MSQPPFTGKVSRKRNNGSATKVGGACFRDIFCGKVEGDDAERPVWSQPSFWTELLQHALTIDPAKMPTRAVTKKAARCSTMDHHFRESLANEGFVLVDSDEQAKNLVETLASGIERLHAQEWPASFIFLFDQAWEMAHYCWQEWLQKACRPCHEFTFDVLAWYIPPGDSGFAPHRDRQPEDVAFGFHSAPGEAPDAKYVTLWMALTEATPHESSCLYFLPAGSDPGYHAGDLEGEHDKDPLQRALATKECYQNIVAVPRQPGESVMFTHRIIHWGSKHHHYSSQPQAARIAISFVSSEPHFEAPYLCAASSNEPHDNSNVQEGTTSNGPKDHASAAQSRKRPNSDAARCQTLETPPFPQRLLLVCAQLIIYHERFSQQMSKANLKACYEYCKAHEHLLEPRYRQKVFVEFVKAMKEYREGPAELDDDMEKHSAAGKKPPPCGATAKESGRLPAKWSNKAVSGGSDEGNQEDREDADEKRAGEDKDEDEEEEDAMLEEMLNAEQDGYGDEFHDDYDDMDHHGQDET